MQAWMAAENTDHRRGCLPYRPCSMEIMLTESAGPQRLSEWQIHGIGALSTLIQSALEVALGPDAKIVDAW